MPSRVQTWYLVYERYQFGNRTNFNFVHTLDLLKDFDLCMYIHTAVCSDHARVVYLMYRIPEYIRYLIHGSALWQKATFVAGCNLQILILFVSSKGCMHGYHDILQME